MSHRTFAHYDALLAAMALTKTVVILSAFLPACVGTSATTQRAPEQIGLPMPAPNALAFERGDGVARDYAAAASIHESECRGDLHDMAACRRLLEAMVENRGRTRGIEEVLGLVDYMCKHHDVLACEVSAYTGLPLPKDFDLAAEITIKEAACANGDAVACEVLLNVAPGHRGSSAREESDADLADKACNGGLLAACIRLVEPLRNCPDQTGTNRCIEKQEREWAKHGEASRLHALARVREACDDGDAEACEVLPGRELPYAELCRAHDFAACAALGCLGDPAAAATAKERGIDANCHAIEAREAARHTPRGPRRNSDGP